jgi:hypothetical protein
VRQEYISVKVLTLEELFSGPYHFRLPFFQRAYAWRTGEVGRLLTNILEAMSVTGEARRYFLGKLMLAKKPGNADTALVDGHQRIMSLTILFSVLRDLAEDDATKARLNGFITGSQYRLSPQESIAAICDRYVQAPGATETDPEEDLSELSETERNIIENRNYFRSEFSDREATAETRRTLVDFLAANCCVIVCSVQDEDEAWQILKIEEETRVNFSKNDRAKSSLLSIVAPEERAACRLAWEKCEGLLGPTDMYALLEHLRTLKPRRKRIERPVEIDIAEDYKLNTPGAGKAFMEGELVTAATRLAAIRGGEIGSQKDRPAIAACIERTGWIHEQLWIPAALHWLSQPRDDGETALFFRRLERLVWTMKIAGFDPTKQHRRILQLIQEIDRNVKVDAMREFEIGKTLRDPMLRNLRSTSFDSKTYCARVLRRISIALGHDSGPIDPKKVTVEHVLPKSWQEKSGWRRQFPTKRSVFNHAHRLGNLTFLTEAENQQADTLDWTEKRRIFARSKLVLSNRLGATVDWTPDAISSRTEDLIRILFGAWDLKI